MLDEFIRHTPKAIFEHFYNGCHFFDFKTSETDMVMTDFALSLSKKGLLRLPFPKSFFKYDNKKEGCIVKIFYLHGRDEIEKLLAISKESLCFDIKSWGQVFASLTGIEVKGHKLPVVMHVFEINGSTTEIDCNSNYVVYRDKKDESGSVNAQNQHFVKQFQSVTLIHLHQFPVYLMSKSFEVTQKTIKNKNVLRAQKKSQYPVFEWNTVRLNPNHVKAMAAATGQTHASPRLHWRRGHYRRWKGELIPVAPCLVGCASNGIIHKDYIVEAA